MSTRKRQSDNDHDRPSWSEQYETLLEVLDETTGPPPDPTTDRAAVRRPDVSVKLGERGVRPSTSKRLLERARENGDIVRIKDWADRDSYALKTPAGLKAIVDALNEDPDAYEIDQTQVAEWIAEVTDDE